MQIITLSTLILGWSFTTPATVTIIVTTLFLGQVVALLGYRKAVNLVFDQHFSAKRVQNIIVYIVLGVRVSVAIAFAVVIYFETPHIAAGAAVGMLLVIVFGSLVTDQMSWRTTSATILQAVIVAFALYLRDLHSGFVFVQISLEHYNAILVMAAVVAISKASAVRAIGLRMHRDQVKLSNNDKVTNAMFNASTEGIAVADQEGRLLRVNDRFYELLMVEPVLWMKSIKSKLPSSIQFGQTGEVVVENKAGRILNVDQRRSDLEGGGEIILFVVRDLTETRQMSIENLHMQKINAIGMLAGGIAHDFNNLLAVIQGNAELIDASVHLDGRQKEYLDTIIASTNRASSLTTQLMSFNHKQEAKAVLVAADKMVFEAIKIVRPLLGVHIELVQGQTTNTNIKVNHATFLTALLNLMFNARDAMNANGTLTVSAIDSGHNSVLFCVGDNGAGIPTELLDKVTTPFFTTKPSDQGTGLGLSMVMRFVESAGGQFWLDSNHAGTRATIELPSMKEPVYEEKREIFENALPEKILNVLVIDDNVDYGHTLLEQICFLGHTAVVEYSLEGVSKLDNLASFDLIICDHLLETDTAIKVYDWFREEELSPFFVLISGNIPAEDLAHIEQREVFSILQKPIAIQQLSKMLDNVINAQLN